MQQIGFLEFWEFMWRERSNLWRFLKWTGEIERYVHPAQKRPIMLVWRGRPRPRLLTFCWNLAGEGARATQSY